MIKDIEVYNFRCFQKTKIKGFAQINLIGGKNNSGKTSLLETLYLNASPHSESIFYLRNFRKETTEFAKALPEQSWDNFFYNQNKHNIAKIICNNTQDKPNIIEISCEQSTKSFITLLDEKEAIDNSKDLKHLLSQGNNNKPTLHLHQYINGKAFLLTSILAYPQVAINNPTQNTIKKTSFIPASFRLPPSALASEYDKSDLNNQSNKVYQAIQLIDNSIEKIKTLSIGEPMLYLKRKNENFLPLSLFGEAFNKVVELILRLINNQNSILLIDEIENGIHHTSQRDLWQMLFKLAHEFEVQIFATTHSLEMLQAFVDVGLAENNKGLGAYIELTRSARNGQIIGVNHKLDTLVYELERKVAVRGE